MINTDLAYLAGIFDGEGTIFIEKSKTANRKHDYRFRLTVNICSTDEWLIKWLKQCWGGYVYFEARKIKNNNLKNAWHWSLQNRKAAEFLKNIIGYLHIKLPQAKLALKFQAHMQQGGHRTKDKSDQNYLEQEECYSLMKDMKR
ncbi:MAG: LAGLIDADG family homing endonuclease [Methylobacter tundripaludum]|nr:LAGLIDADG family homing endonuclease [Methylobacter tundripaludum]